MEVQHLFLTMAPTHSVLSNCLGYQYVDVWLHWSPAALPQGSFMTSQVPAVVLSSMRKEQTTKNEEIQIKSIKPTVKSCI